MPPKKKATRGTKQTTKIFDYRWDEIKEYALGLQLLEPHEPKPEMTPELQKYVDEQIQFIRDISRHTESEKYLRKTILQCEDGEYFGQDNFMSIFEKYS